VKARVLVVCAALLALGGCRAPRDRDQVPSSLPSGAVPVPDIAPSAALPAQAAAPLPVSTVPLIAMPLSFAPLAKAADPGVVTVVSLVEERTRTGRIRVVREGLGTGFVYDRSGLILTNHHVVEASSEISVKLADGRDVVARVVGTDKPADVAVLRVDERGLTALALGDSDAIDVGDWVVAIGNPFGLAHTVSAGILSGKGRTRDEVKGLDPSGYFNFLQTDAAINQGNSGGPLLNLRGEVVGINTAIRANANNIGFAIPINMVKQLLPALLRDGRIKRSAIGVIVDSLNEAEAVRLKRPDRKGAWIKLVYPGQGADRAGLARDDVIVAFGGKSVQDPNELRWVASLAGVGRTVAVRVQRGAKVFDVPVTLGPLKDEEQQRGLEGPP
jgi:serine protease Do